MQHQRLDERVAAQEKLPLAEATGLILAGRVAVDGVIADKPGQTVTADAALTIRPKARQYASRSGYKLEKALRVFGVDPTGLAAVDVGASNGGFTDCLLQHGAAHVCAVDVAYGILAWELRQDPRVAVLERTNARRLTAAMVDGPCPLVTADVSFISLRKIFPAIDAVLTAEGQCICLVKPQFEAAQRQVGRHGVLKDPADLPPLLADVVAAAGEHRLFLAGMTVSPIHGTNGNVEYLAHFTRRETAPEQWEAFIAQAVAEQPDED